jgi:hypothetical protein
LNSFVSFPICIVAINASLQRYSDIVVHHWHWYMLFRYPLLQVDWLFWENHSDTLVGFFYSSFHVNFQYLLLITHNLVPTVFAVVFLSTSSKVRFAFISMWYSLYELWFLSHLWSSILIQLYITPLSFLFSNAYSSDILAL